MEDLNITDMAKEITESKKAIMDEVVFVNYFLPYFRGDVKDKQLIGKWIEYVGGSMNECDVLDNNGILIYTVPPVIASIDVEKSMSIPYSMMEEHIDKEMERLPIKASNEYKELLSEAVDSIIPMDYSEIWKNIFERYEEKEKSLMSDKLSEIDEDEIRY